MTGCDFDVVLYFYGEMEPAARKRAEAHLRECAACQLRLADLDAIREALASRPAAAAPPTGDWSGFMRRLDQTVRAMPAPEFAPSTSANTGFRPSARQAMALAAMVALVTIGVVTAARYRSAAPASQAPAPASQVVAAPPPATVTQSTADISPDHALREMSAEHLERSKLVVLGLATRDPYSTTADDWQYERRLAGTLLNDTRLYRIAAQDRGVTDVARVMRDLETVLLEASLSDSSDKDALGRVQRLISKRDLVVKMQVVTGSAGL